MTLISIANKKARPVNPHPYIIRVGGKDLSITKVNTEWEAFEQSVTEHEAPGCEEGEAEGVLIWQDRFLKGRWADSVGNERNSNPESETRQIWIVSTPEKVEVKEEPVQKYKSMDEININDYPHVLMDIIGNLLFDTRLPGNEWLKTADPILKQEVLEEFVKTKIYEQQF